MGVSHMIITTSPRDFMFDTDAFIREAQRRWPGCEVFREIREKDPSDATVQISPQNKPSFSVDHFPDNQMVSIDGNPDNSAEVAAWVRQMHPNPDLVLWFIDESFSGHTVLFPGITAQEVLDNWADHSEHNPYTEYPDYFK